MKEIRVTGKAKLTIIPDRTIVNLSIEGIEEEYKNAINQSKKLSKEIKDIFIDLGFQREDVKTKNFQIEASYKREFDENNNWKVVFKGYEFKHTISVGFDKDNELLGKILYELSKCSAAPKLSLEYTVKDADSIKNALLRNAVQDSKRKAELLAQSSAVTLGNIINIDYSWGEVNISTGRMDRFMDYMKLSNDEDFDDEFFDIDIEPDDISVSDTVTIVWEIK